MGLHDDYSGVIFNCDEFKAFKRNTEKSSLTADEIDALVKKYKYDFVFNDEDAQELIDQLPASYKPDQARIEKQKAVSDRLNEEMLRTEIAAAFNPIVKAAHLCNKGFFDRHDISFLSAIALYGSEESKQILKEKGSELENISKQLEELKAKQKAARDKARKEARRNPDYKATELEDIEKQIREVTEVHLEKMREFREAYRDIAPKEIAKFASEMDAFVDKLNKASDPEFLLENYRELRIKSQMFGESVPIMNSFKRNFSPVEFDLLNIQFGRAYGPQFKLLDDATIIAHPLGKNLDLNALKAVDSDVLQPILNQFMDRIYIRSQKLAAAYEDDPLKQKVMPNMSGETNLITGVGKNVTAAFNLWNSNIRNLYGKPSCDILVQTLDGRNMVLSEKTMVQLYKEGMPFFAQPRTVFGQPATLFQPLDGYDLAYGDGILNAEAADPGAAPEAPHPLVKAWDTFIAAIGRVFGLNWRVDSVAKYETDLDIYTTKKNLFDGLNHSKEYYDDLKMQGGQIELERYAAELDAEEAAKAAREEAARVEAERTELFDNAHLSKAQKATAMSILKACDFEIRNGVNPHISYQKQFANVMTAFTTQKLIEGKLKNAAETGTLDPQIAELLNSGSDGELFISREAEKLEKEPQLTNFLSNMTKEAFNKIVNGKVDSVTAANILKAASDYNAYKTAEKEKVEKILGKENVKAEEKVIENLAKKMN